MIPTTLLQPPSAPPEAPKSGERRKPAPALARERRSRYRRLVAIGIIVSVLIHLLVIFASPLFVRYVESIGIPIAPSPQPAAPPMGTIVIDYRITDTPTPVEPREEVPEPDRAAPGPTPTPTAPAGTGEAEEAAPTPTAAERLRPRVGDWRLWVTPPLRDREPTPAEREAALRRRLYVAIDEYNDSIAAAEAR